MLKSATFYCVKLLNVGLFYLLSVETLKIVFFCRVKPWLLLQPPPPRILPSLARLITSNVKLHLRQA